MAWSKIKVSQRRNENPTPNSTSNRSQVKLSYPTQRSVRTLTQPANNENIRCTQTNSDYVKGGKKVNTTRSNPKQINNNPNRNSPISNSWNHHTGLVSGSLEIQGEKKNGTERYNTTIFLAINSPFRLMQQNSIYRESIVSCSKTAYIYRVKQTFYLKDACNFHQLVTL